MDGHSFGRDLGGMIKALGCLLLSLGILVLVLASLVGWLWTR